MSLATACQAVLETAVAVLRPISLATWRCRNVRCRPLGFLPRILMRLEYDGRSIIEAKCTCNAWNRLPNDARHLKDERAADG